MAKKDDRRKFDHRWIVKAKPLLYRQLLYEIARLYVEEGKKYSEIPEEIDKWAEDKPIISEYCKNQNRGWAEQRVKEAIDMGLIKLADFTPWNYLEKIKERFHSVKNVSIKIAPDDEMLLRQVCLDFVERLTEKVKATPSHKEVVVGVSGGHTMLALTQTLHDIKPLMSWGKMESQDKDKVVVCSLTSGGTRDDFFALSDTIAANLANELGVKARGLLGPPSFKDKIALDTFKNEPEIQEHIKLVSEASIILTSVGNVHNDKALTSEIYKVVDPAYLGDIRKQHTHIGDIIYQCYDGDFGEVFIPSQAIKDRIFSVILLDELCERVKSKQTQSFVVAKGYDKGNCILRGLILSGLASDIYMDIECAKGLHDVIYKK